MRSFDALVVGGGPAGAVAALALARAGLAVAVVERTAFPRRKVCGEFISATTWPLLRRLGVADRLAGRAGPPVNRVGFYAHQASVHAPMPEPGAADASGRAIGRESLDTALLEAAARAGATVWQPWSLDACEDDGRAWQATLVGPRGAVEKLPARIVVAAHGSWEPGRALASQPRRLPPRAHDLLGFKARFVGARLPARSMPLVLFEGGYGGLVESDAGRTSFSFCIRRDALEAARASSPRACAGEAAASWAIASCEALRPVLDDARLEGPWLGAGPIRPGIRALARGRLFAVGNAAGEAHPLVAEGLSMAMQSGWLLATAVARSASLDDASIAQARRLYSRAWRDQFAARVCASRAFAGLALAPGGRRAGAALIARIPDLLTWGARRAGKAAPLPSLEAFP